VEFANLFTFDKFHVWSGITKGTKYFAKKLLDSPGYHQRQRALKAHHSSTAEDNFGFHGICEVENSILDFRIFEDFHIACSNI